MGISVNDYLAMAQRVAMFTQRKHDASVTERIGPPVEKESDLHDDIIAYCREHDLHCVHSRMDRRTTVGVGTLDFVIACDNGRTVWLEAKSKTGKLRPAQAAAIAQLKKRGHIAEVVDNWPEAKAILDLLGG